MTKFLMTAGLAALMSTSAMAQNIGVTMAKFDDNFLTVLRNGIQAQADAAGLSVQIEDAADDVAKQLDQI
nr:rhizopine-binding protein [Paracoccaceae bacterium]